MVLPRRRISFWAAVITVWLLINWYVIFTLRGGSSCITTTNVPKVDNLDGRFSSLAGAVHWNLTHSYRQGAIPFGPADETLASDYVNIINTFPKDKRYLTIAMSSVYRRRNNYLIRTLATVLRELSLEDRKNVHIVVFLGDLDESLKRKQLSTISKKLSRYNFIHVIQASKGFYPSLTNLKQKFGDSPSRIRWRSKQNVDFSFLMFYCSSISEYYLHLEDDVISSPSFFSKLKDVISLQSKPWTVLSTAINGHIGKVLHNDDLKSLALFYYMFYDEMPCDWLIIFWKKVKDPFMSENNLLASCPGSLFQHFGKDSSLEEKTQNLTEPYFDAFNHKYNGLNPTATVTSNIAIHKGTPEDAYNKGIGYFWGKGLNIDDFIQIHFKLPVQIKRIVISTGSNMAPQDVLLKGALDASYKEFDPEKKNNENGVSCGDFIQLSTFKVKLDLGMTSQTAIGCLRIRVTEKQTPWLFLREINVWTWQHKDILKKNNIYMNST